MTNQEEFISLEQETDQDSGRPTWLVGLVFLLLIGMVALFVADKLYHPEKFQIKQIDIRGSISQINIDAVTEVIQNKLSGNYFSVSLESIESQIKDIPWVYDAALRRRWPSTLVVNLEEVQPIAEWGDAQWLNATGDLVQRQPWDQPLPILRGPRAMQETVWKAFQDWHGVFASHGISLESLELDERELWYLSLSLTPLAKTNAVSEDWQSIPEAKVTMIVDNSDADGRIKRLIRALNNQLIAEFPGMKSIDLRYPNGFAIEWQEGLPVSQKLTDSE